MERRLGNELLEPQLLCLFVLAARVVVGHLLTYAYYRPVARQLRELKGTPLSASAVFATPTPRRGRDSLNAQRGSKKPKVLCGPWAASVF